MEQYGQPKATRSPLRRASVSDIPEVVRLVSIMFADLGTRTDPSWAEQTGEALTRRLWSDLGIFVVDAAESRPLLAACAVGVLHQSLPSPRRPTQTTAYIEWVVTDPAWRRQGHGQSATVALVDWLIDQGAAVIDVHSSAAAEPLYRRLGFTNDGPVALRLRTMASQAAAYPAGDR
jgi:GNAT superfamily N-acetyltransferase